LGKSQIHCSFAAIATTERTWPNGAPAVEPCRVIMLTAEDNTEDVLVPRLQAAGANLDLIHELKAIKRNNRDEWFLLGEDLDVLDEMVGDYGDVGLILIDPITAYMGGGKKFDSHRATDVRAQLNPIKVLAEQRSIAISCLTHPPKNASQRALDHFIASQAFIAVPRIGHVCVPEMESDPTGNKHETGRRLFTNQRTTKPANNRRSPIAPKSSPSASTTRKERLSRVARCLGGRGRHHRRRSPRRYPDDESKPRHSARLPAHHLDQWPSATITNHRMRKRARFQHRPTQPGKACAQNQIPQDRRPWRPMAMGPARRRAGRNRTELTYEPET
jgi:hypothetical protein